MGPMNAFDVQVLDPPSPLFQAQLGGALARYNDGTMGAASVRPLAVVTLDPRGMILGGMSGWLQWGWLYIDLAWVDEAYRRQGLGSGLLVALEQAAIERGVDRAHLTTGSFQAPGFYERHGYAIVLEQSVEADDGSEHLRYTMHKLGLGRADTSAP